MDLFGFHSIQDIALSLLPVFCFLAGLIILDTFKLIHIRAILLSIFVGFVVAVIAYYVNTSLLTSNRTGGSNYTVFIGPIVEESLKSVFLFYLISKKKIGFMVDGAIHGFAIGAGFSFVENLVYLHAVASSNILLWVIRGFGTAVMHGGTTAIVGIVASEISTRVKKLGTLSITPALVTAIIIHALYNYFILRSVMTAVLLIILLPTMIVFIFQKSESSTRAWLGVGFDMDLELLNIILSGNLPETKLGMYFRALQDRFPGEVIADMVCLLRIHLELSIRAKGILLMKESGFDIQPSSEVSEKFEEMRYLQKNIGRTGYLALLPLLHRSSRDLWQIHMLTSLE